MDNMACQFRLAQAYIPIQTYIQRWPPMVGLERGTIFPELYRPYEPHDC
jgi:hypothetical protein